MTKADFSREVTQARDDRAQAAGVGRIFTGLFIAALGPMAVVLLPVLRIAEEAWMNWAILATSPAGALWAVISLLRLPRRTPGAVFLVLLALGAAALTLKLAL